MLSLVPLGIGVVEELQAASSAGKVPTESSKMMTGS